MIWYDTIWYGNVTHVTPARTGVHDLLGQTYGTWFTKGSRVLTAFHLRAQGPFIAVCEIHCTLPPFFQPIGCHEKSIACRDAAPLVRMPLKRWAGFTLVRSSGGNVNPPEHSVELPSTLQGPWLTLRYWSLQIIRSLGNFFWRYVCEKDLKTARWTLCFLLKSHLWNNFNRSMKNIKHFMVNLKQNKNKKS